jgi:putative FmdB family regulatory protein
MILYDFECKSCGHRFETLVHRDDVITPCESEGCAGEAERCIGATKTFSVIVATSRTSKGLKAGFVHSHSPKRPRTKISSAVPRGPTV